MKRLNEQVTKVEEHSAEQVKVFEDALSALAETPVQFEAVTNEKGHLFKGIHAGDIAKVLQKNGFHIHEDSIILKQPIKEIGIHEVSLQFGGKKGSCRLEVVKK
jgi:ribosomal protein L9